jgi:hypothetical protein
MSDQESKRTAELLDQLAEQLASLGGAPAALRMIAGALRGDDAMAERWLIQFLHHVEIGELLGAATLKLEQAAADGNLDARRAAEHVATAGAIYYGEGR